MLELTGVRKIYGEADQSFTALDDVTLHLGAGEFSAIVGPSGCGKSTLLNIIGLLDRPTAGRVRLNGRDIDISSRAEAARLRNRLIGFVFQSFQLLPRLRVWQNVALPLFYRGVGGAERRSQALDMLGQVGLQARADHSPVQLSGGQRQRVALARALVGRPKLLLADEPTGSLDSVTSTEVMALLRDLNRSFGVTIVMVTHDRELAAQCDRRIEMLDGRVRHDSGPRS